MSKIGTAIIPKIIEGGGYGRRGHYQDEAGGNKEAAHNK